MATPAPPRISKYCPRCDRRFEGSAKNVKLLDQTLDAHVRRSHPDYLPLWEG